MCLFLVPGAALLTAKRINYGEKAQQFTVRIGGCCGGFIYSIERMRFA